MNLARWEPFTGADEIFNRLMPNVLGRWPKLTLSNGESKYAWSPSADISETDKEYLIRAELPAVRNEDVKVTVDQGVITIEGERKQQTEDKNEKYHRVESFYGSFARSFSLPDNTNVDAIRCESKDGVLVVHVPKATPAAPKSKQIKID
ncbi:MAG TPA: Hsp20/alpha crystallin family protein [Steroidobacteraceae bacterium]|nr:Hsp20/alpha crystallin family protein [Steroidobacteraceae bacterium]